MKGCYFKFRNFDNVKFNFSQYLSGNIKVEVYLEDGIKLCELTEDYDALLPKGFFVFKDTTYTAEFIKKLMWMDFIDYYKPTHIKGNRFYLCGLSKNNAAAVYGDMNRVAVGGAL